MFQKKGNKLHRGQDESGTDFSRAVAVALRTELGSTHQAIKIAMRWTGASERTAKHWLAGTHGPSGEYLVELLRHSDEVFRVVLALAERKNTMSEVNLGRLRHYLALTLECLQEESNR